MNNEAKEISNEKFIIAILIIVLTFVLLFIIAIQKPEILTSVIEKLTELLKTSGFGLGIVITTITIPKLYK